MKTAAAWKRSCHAMLVQLFKSTLTLKEKISKHFEAIKNVKQYILAQSCAKF